MNRSEAEEALRACLVERRFGDAGRHRPAGEITWRRGGNLLALVSDGHVLRWHRHRIINALSMVIVVPIPAVWGRIRRCRRWMRRRRTS